MPALQAVHDTDPAKELMKKVKKTLPQVDLFGNSILVAIYVRPETAQYKTLTLQLSDKTRDEDKHQGKVGLVVKMGPQAYVDDELTQFHGQNVKVGDWVVFRTGDGWPITLTENQTLCRVLTESGIRMKIDSPDAVW
jgi:co-chaperonin GroES (HSP10)